MSLIVKEGNYTTLGVTVAKNQITFTFEGEKEDNCCIVSVQKETEEKKVIEVPKEYCLGSLRSITISGISSQELQKYYYYYEINGKKVVDAYAKVISGREIWNDELRKEHKYKVYSSFLTDTFSWGNDKQPEIPKSQMVMYKLHVRGFTMASKMADKIKGTFMGIKNKIPYLKDLGVTTIELMPMYEFEEMPIPEDIEACIPDYVKWQAEKEDLIQPIIVGEKEEEKKLNYWGYSEGNYFAVKASYASEPKKASIEFKKLIKSLHENNMECVMEMFFPHDTNCNLILDALRFWVREYHVDGFHILGTNLPLLAIAQDAILSRTKIFAEGFPYISNPNRKYKNLYVYKEEYQYAVRKLLNHFQTDICEFVNQQKKQGDELGYINYISTTNGFTLTDLFMYNDKHNEANGENNSDGPEYNFSNNYGIEGPSRKRYINEIRRQRIRTAFMMLFFAQGIPLFMAGDEFGNSQKGNNNAYCQDNEIGWVDWSQFLRYKKEREFIKQLITFRKEHSVIANEKPYRFYDYRALGMPDLSYHGEYAWITQLDPGKKSVGMLYCGAYASKDQDISDIYIAYNFYSEKVSLALPQLPAQKKWYLKMDSSLLQTPILEEVQEMEDQRSIEVESQTICLLIGK
ncbi:MAG: glycogen operon protein GlgX [Lachnospiraceae bacterium]|nr:glycogen operon protein GlgX [Lachnospiraceae bacterium]